MADNKGFTTAGFRELLTKIGATFIKKTDTEQISTIDIDASPTASSTNLVTSGGVYTAVNAKSVVSGTNDGTNWSTITINGTSKNIPQGGSGTVTSVSVSMNGATKGTVTTSGTIDLGTVITSHQDISGKADKTATVSNVAYDTTNDKFTKTINGATTDIVTVSTLKTDMALNNVENKSSATIRGEITANDIPSLDASKITSGTFADARIASASTWNNKLNSSNTTADATTTISFSNADMEIDNGFVVKTTSSSSESEMDLGPEIVAAGVTSSGSSSMFNIASDMLILASADESGESEIFSGIALQNDGTITINTTNNGTIGLANGGIIIDGTVSGTNNLELTNNKVTSLSAFSTDTQYPSAKCVYELVGNIESLLEELL